MGRIVRGGGEARALPRKSIPVVLVTVNGTFFWRDCFSMLMLLFGAVIENMLDIVASESYYLHKGESADGLPLLIIAKNLKIYRSILNYLPSHSGRRSVAC